MGRRALASFLFAITFGLGAIALTAAGCSSEPTSSRGAGGRTGLGRSDGWFRGRRRDGGGRRDVRRRVDGGGRDGGGGWRPR